MIICFISGNEYSDDCFVAGWLIGCFCMFLSFARSLVWNNTGKQVLLLLASYVTVLGSTYIHFTHDANGDSGPFLFAVVLIAGAVTLFMILASVVSTYLYINFAGNVCLKGGAVILLLLALAMCLCATYAWGLCVHKGGWLFAPTALSYGVLAIVYLRQIVLCCKFSGRHW